MAPLHRLMIPVDLRRGQSSFLVVLVLVLVSQFPVNECTAQRIRGYVGGNIEIRCPVEPRPLYFMYLQKDKAFVNGYFETKSVPNTMNHTSVSEDKTTVYMENLKVSHAGDYECVVKYKDSHGIQQTFVHLEITANFSKPEVTKHQSDDSHWLVTCSSHGGYPKSQMTWGATEGLMVKVLNLSETLDLFTETWNSFSKALINCSSEEMTNLSCSVGGVTSDIFLLCKPEKPHGTLTYAVAIIVAVISFIIACVVACWMKCKKTTGPPPSSDVWLQTADVNTEQDCLTQERTTP